ncbi:MAG: aspartate racemase [Planctomycetota bacterium]|jgi:aspartate racemase
MKTIGLLGGMSWESTVTYYQTINRIVGRELGGLHSARIAMHSVEFQEIQELQHAGKWHETGVILADAAKSIERAGADLLVLCTNTMHIVAPQIEAATSLPFLHIADATAARIKAQGIERVGLLGTRFTMEESFYRGRLESNHGLSVVTPNADDRTVVHRVIYEELCRGKIDAASRAEYARIVAALIADGAQGVILGCTEIGLLLRPEDSPVPLFDTAHIHAEAAAFAALA